MRSKKSDSPADFDGSRAGDVTALLAAYRQGDGGALDRLAAYIYPQLLRIASDRRRRQTRSVTLSTGDLAHEAYAKVLAAVPDAITNRPALMRALARAIQNLLVDHYRRRQSAKRGGSWEKIEIEGLELSAAFDVVDQVALKEAMERLHERSEIGERCHEVVLLRYYGGLEMGEIAEVLGVSRRTVDHDWQFARAFLARTMPHDDATGDWADDAGR